MPRLVVTEVYPVAESDGDGFVAAEVALETHRESAAPHDGQESDADSVWISEVYPAAGQGSNDYRFEWFELTNSSDAEILLNGWTVADNTASDPLDGVILPANSSVVIAGSDAVDAAHAIIPDGRIGNGLANSGDRLRLIDSNGEVVSAISWGDDRTFTTIASPTPDQSLQRPAAQGQARLAAPTPGFVPVPTQTASRTSTDSTESTQPSAVTEQASAAVLPLRITEIMPAPLAGEPEWVELFNPTDRAVDLVGWTLSDPARSTVLSGVIAPNSRLVIATGEVDAPALQVERIGNGLNNDGDLITLKNAEGVIVDQVEYGSAAIPAPERGLSIALDPARWVVTAAPSPGADDVTPLLGDAFRSASIREPVADSEGLPVVQETSDGGSNAWMIVSFALIGVIFTLVVRRWRPDETEPQTEAAPAPAQYSGPPPDDVIHGDD